MIVVPHQAPPARRWLAHLVRASSGVDVRREPLPATPSFDSASVFELARQECVAPLLHLGFVEGRIVDPLPDAFRSACEGAYYRTLSRNIVALRTGQRILHALQSAGIAAAPVDGWAVLKGPFRYHADPGSRPLEHLELVLRESDVARAESTLAELGYRRTRRRAAALRDGHELAFRHNEAGADLFVELRWGWEGSGSRARSAVVSGDQFLDGLCDTTISGHHRPTRVANLLVASTRAAYPTLGRWIRLDDTHRLVTAVPLDWDEVVAAARRWRVCAPLYAGLVSARELFGTPIPRAVLARIAPGPVRRRLLHRSLAASQRTGGAPRAVRRAHLLLADSWWEVARAATRTTAPRSAGAAVPGGLPTGPVRLSHSVRVVSPSGDDR